MGKALGGGSGWVLLSWSPRDRKLVNQWASDHCHTLAGGTPILARDMYEHSYITSTSVPSQRVTSIRS
jgi:superoxide dismutase, Fe-Mn family